MSDPDHQRIPRRVLFRRRFHGIRSLPLQRFADTLCQRVLKGDEFVCLVTDAPELALLNKDFRGKSESTDVLSFPATPDSAQVQAETEAYAGDIAISVTHARAQARLLGHSLEQEICILMLHGVLHLAGMDHEQDDGAMGRAEKRWRHRFGLPQSLTERADQ